MTKIQRTSIIPKATSSVQFFKPPAVREFSDLELIVSNIQDKLTQLMGSLIQKADGTTDTRFTDLISRMVEKLRAPRQALSSP